MTFRHTLMLRFKDGATDEEKQRLLDGLSRLPAEIDVIRRYEFGCDLGLGDGNPDLALVADFDSEADWRIYGEHPVHLEVVATVLRPVVSEVARVQYLVD